MKMGNSSLSPLSLREAVKKLKKVGVESEKILDYTYNYKVFSFYPN